MTERPRRSPWDLLAMLGGGLLLGSLFLTWSHQLGRAELGRFHGAVLFGVAANPTAFQVYASAGILLAGLAVGIVAAGLLAPHGGLVPSLGGWGLRPGRGLTLVGTLLGLAFAVRAAGSAPTNGLLLAQGSGAHARYAVDPATAGPGETVAIVGLVCAAVGLAAAMVAPRTEPVLSQPSALDPT